MLTINLSTANQHHNTLLNITTKSITAV